MVLIYPEITDYSSDFAYVTKNLFYPLATYARTRNTQIHIRSKHAFWFGDVHLKNWERIANGEFADIFVPSMEETEDKAMELTVAGRMGFWASGAVNEWGTRGVLDNAGYNRIRQHAYQRLPNHHLRQNIYALANGATHINNFQSNSDYMSLVWELVAKGALYIPKKSEILSISPVHLSMTNHPDSYFLEQATYVKWLVNYDETIEENNKLVFGRMNGTWMGSPVNEWDFSAYAVNEIERRLNFIPSYNNGMVLITPVQNGYFAKIDVPRGKLTDHLHPIYKDIMTEFITDGRNYYSADSSKIYQPEIYFDTLKTAIEEKATLLPLTVSGDVGWVVAQTDKRHLRLTIIDGGWINPSDKTVSVSFHTVSPIRMKDILDNTTFDISNPSDVSVDIPCGMFRFIDIELAEDFIINTDNDTINTGSLHIYPNPATDYIKVDFQPTTETAQFQIFDISGKLVYQTIENSIPNIKNTVEFDVANLAKGTYVIYWLEENLSGKFVK